MSPALISSWEPKAKIEQKNQTKYLSESQTTPLRKEKYTHSTQRDSRIGRYTENSSRIGSRMGLKAVENRSTERGVVFAILLPFPWIDFRRFEPALEPILELFSV